MVKKLASLDTGGKDHIKNETGVRSTLYLETMIKIKIAKGGISPQKKKKRVALTQTERQTPTY